MRRDLVYRDKIMDSLVKEYNRKRTNDGLKLAWIEKAVNDVEPAPIDLPDKNVGDLISRKAVLYALDKRFDSIPMEQTQEILLLRKDLREMPPITPMQELLEVSANRDYWQAQCRVYKAEIERIQLDIIHCKDCDWWTRQKDSLQGRCALTGSYPTGGWYCGNARRATE